MQHFSPLLDQLIDALRCLPGVGSKTAQRMAFYLLQGHRENGLHLSTVLQKALTQIIHCEQCHTFSEEKTCGICRHPKRLKSQLCIVEMPADILAIEQTSAYQGLYFVLMGHLSPIDQIGPKELGLDQLQKRIQQDSIEEIILATNATVEGDATAHYIKEMVKPFEIKTSRIAFGIPLGGELEYIDGQTLSRALLRRELID